MLTKIERDALMKAIAGYVQEAVREEVTRAVGEAVAKLPEPKPGPAGKDGESIVGPAGKDGESIVGPQGAPGRDGKDVDMNEVRTLIQAEITRAVAEIPRAKDGKDGARILIGDGPPLDTAAPGDVYIDAATWTIYQQS